MSDKGIAAHITHYSHPLSNTMGKNDIKSAKRDFQKSSKGREMFSVIREYTEYSTIQGLIYLSLPKQTQAGRLFWSAVIAGMLILGSYWSIEAYQVKSFPIIIHVRLSMRSS